MKKFLGVLGLSLVMLCGSCSNDDSVELSGGDQVKKEVTASDYNGPQVGPIVSFAELPYEVRLLMTSIITDFEGGVGSYTGPAVIECMGMEAGAVGGSIKYQNKYYSFTAIDGTMRDVIYRKLNYLQSVGQCYYFG